MAFVPYRGGPQALLDLAEGRIQAVVSTLAAALGAARGGGKVRMLATAARARAAAAPELPTAAEAGFPGSWAEGLLGLFGWRGMPEAARDALSAQATGPSGKSRPWVRIRKVISLFCPDHEES